MRLTDPEAIKALRKANLCELEDMISDYPEDEVDGRTDWEMIANEAGWLLDSCISDGCARHDDILECRRILRKTDYGKSLLLNARTLRPIYDSETIRIAKNTINEYNRLVRFVAKLKKMGLYCPYC